MTFEKSISFLIKSSFSAHSCAIQAAAPAPPNIKGKAFKAIGNKAPKAGKIPPFSLPSSCNGKSKP